MFNKKTIRDVDLRGRVVLVRVDYNVPIEYSDDGQAEILNDFRIKSSLPTIKYLLDLGVRKIVLISHMGRPESVEGVADLNELEKLPNGSTKFSLRPTFNRLIRLLAEDAGVDEHEFRLNFPMNFHSAPIFARTRYSVPIAKADDDYKIEMLENLRFSKDEKRDSIEFAEALVQVTGADLFVQDGFGVVHRAHASTDAITKLLPGVSGFLVEKEVSIISEAFQEPKRPFVAVMGGAKVGDKLPLIEKFIEKADRILLAGAMANTILSSRGFYLGNSKIEPGQNDVIAEIYEIARRKIKGHTNNFLVLPKDLAVADEFSSSAKRREIARDSVREGEIALDIGEITIDRFKNELNDAGTIVWNGTVGYSEFPEFSKGSREIAEKISERTRFGALTLVGGGDTSAFALNWSENSPERDNFSLISTGGGAALELMSGAILPGVEALEDKK